MAIRKDALKAKPKAKLISVAGARAKAPAAATRAKAVKPSKKAVTKEPKRRDTVSEGGKNYTKVYSKSPK